MNNPRRPVAHPRNNNQSARVLAASLLRGAEDVNEGSNPRKRMKDGKLVDAPISPYKGSWAHGEETRKAARTPTDSMGTSSLYPGSTTLGSYLGYRMDNPIAGSHASGSSSADLEQRRKSLSKESPASMTDDQLEVLTLDELMTYLARLRGSHMDSDRMADIERATNALKTKLSVSDELPPR